MNLWYRILSFLTRLSKLIEIADSFWRRKKRADEVKNVKKETKENKEVVKKGDIDKLNEKFGWKEK